MNENGNKVKSVKVGIIVLISVVVFGIIGFVSFTYMSKQTYANMMATVESENIYDNISIEGVPVGGLSIADAKIEIIEKYITPRLSDNNLTLTNDDKKWKLSYESLGISFDVDKAVNSAFAIARDGEVKDRYNEIKKLQENPVELKLDFKIDKDLIFTKLEEISKEIEVVPVDATIKRENRKFVITEGVMGKELDREEAYNSILNSVNNEDIKEIPLTVKEKAPKYMASSFDDVQDLIGSFSTPVTGSASRDVNLTVASQKINGLCLLPGEVFSTNDTIGPVTFDNGYKMAPVIIGGKLENGIGGGVCQVSSTLYNAVLYSELEIVERQNHSMTVGYVSAGLDATLAGDYIDFKFKNSTNTPIFLESYLENTRLYFNIYGKETRPANRKLTFDTSVVSYQGAGEKLIQDPTLEEGKRVVETQPLTGKTVVAYKNVLIDGKVVERLKINTSVYKARQGIVRVGTKPLEQLPETPITPDQASPGSNTTLPAVPSIDEPGVNIPEATPIEQEPAPGINEGNSGTTTNEPPIIIEPETPSLEI